MDVNRLKRYIYENNLIQVILEKLGCKDIIYHKEKEYYSASHPDGDNKQGVNIKNSIRLSVLFSWNCKSKISFELNKQNRPSRHIQKNKF